MSTPELRDAMFIPQDYRADFKRVIAKNSHLVKFASGRIKYAGAGLTVTYQAGLVLGYASTGGDAGFYKAYNSANTDGSQVAVGVLAEKAVVDEFGNGSQIAIIKSGDLLQANLIGLDAGAITNLKGSSYLEKGTQILAIYA